MPDEEHVIKEAHGLEWKVVGEFAGRLPLLDLEPLRHPDELPPGCLIKDNTVRTVVRVEDPSSPDGPGLYIKRFKFPIRTTAEGAANAYPGEKGENLDDECLLLEKDLPTPKKLA